MKTTPVVAAIAVLVLGLSGCASTDNEAKESSSGGISKSTVAPGTKVNPNTASEDDVKAALEANGVSNAKKWADEVKEYAPYTKEDMAPKLTEKLGKYKISSEDLAKLLATLEVK